MATATTTLRPFRRDYRTFKNRTGEQVEYYEVHAIDAAGGYVIVRAGTRAPLEGLEVGKTIEFTGEVRAPKSIEVNLMRPLRDDADIDNGTNW